MTPKSMFFISFSIDNVAEFVNFTSNDQDNEYDNLVISTLERKKKTLQSDDCIRWPSFKINFDFTHKCFWNKKHTFSIYISV